MKLLALAMAAAMALVLSQAAHAETCSSCSACRESLDATGAAELSADIATAADCITVTRNNSILDCVGNAIRGSGGAGVTVRDAAFVTIRNCRIANFSTAVRLENAPNATLTSLALEHGQSSGDALYVRGSRREHYNIAASSVTIDGRPVTYAFERSGAAGNDGDGAVIIAWSPSASVDSINISYGDGVRVYHSPGASVRNVTVIGGASSCVGAYMSPSAAYRENTLEGCSGKGFDIDSSPGSVFRSNSVSGCGGRSISVRGTQCSDRQQDIDGTNLVNGAAAKYVYGASGAISLPNTTFLSIACSSGLSVASVNVSYGDPVLLFNVTWSSFSGIVTDAGIEMESSYGNAISSSDVTSPSHGIYIISSDGSNVTGNRIYAVGGDGIHMDGSKGNRITGNAIEDVIGDGIEVYRSENSTVASNNVSQCAGSGIAVKCSTNIAVYGCNSSYNALYGVSLSDGPGVRLESSTLSFNELEGLHVEGQDALTEYLIWHNNIYGNSGSLAQSVAPHQLSMNSSNQGNYWGRSTRPAFVAGTDSNRLDVTDSYPYWKLSGWLYIPVATSVSIQQSKALDPLNCTFTISDQDNATLYANVTWVRNGSVAVEETVPAQNGSSVSQLRGLHKRGETWSCGVEPYDGADWGYMINSSNTTIYNSEPSAPSLNSPASNATLYSTNVTFSYSSSDVDGDNLTYYIFIDGIMAASTRANSSTLTVAAGSHLWTVRAWDGYANSTHSETRPFIVSSSSAPPSAPGTGQGGGGGSLVNMTLADRMEMKQNEVRTYPFSVKAAEEMELSIEASSSSCYGCTFRADPATARAKPGQDAYFQLTVTVPISQPAGEYAITVKALRGGAEAGRKAVVLSVVALPIICADDEEKCDGDRVVACNVYRTGWAEKMQCEFGCSNASCTSEPRMCTPNAVSCSGNAVQTCNSRGNAWVKGQDCIFGCEDGACVAGMDPAVIIIPLAVTVAAVSGVVGYFYMKARTKRKSQDQEREWRRLESRYGSQ